MSGLDILITFIGAVLGGYLLTALKQLNGRPVPVATGEAQIKHKLGLWRAEVESLDRSLLKLKSEDASQPLPQPGESVLLEIPVKGGSALFRSVVTSAEVGSVSVAAPQKLFPRDRRQSPRVQISDERIAKLEGEPAKLNNISRSGASLELFRAPTKGERVCLRVSDFDLMAWVLSVTPSDHGQNVRLKFEETLLPAVLKSLQAKPTPLQAESRLRSAEESY